MKLEVRIEKEQRAELRAAPVRQAVLAALSEVGAPDLSALTVVKAVGHGRRIALDLDTWLMGRVRRRAVVKVEPVAEPLRERAFDFIPRQPIPTAPMGSRFAGLKVEVETGMDKTLAVEEAKRCYLCYLKYEIDVDNCIYCRACIDVAPRDCIKLVSDVEIREDGLAIVDMFDFSRQAPAGADAGGGRKIEDEDLAVANGARVGGLLDGFDHLRGDFVAGSDLELHLGKHVGGVFGTAVDFGLTLLPPKALDLGHRHAGDPDRSEGFTHLVELERLDDRDDELHRSPLCGAG